MLEKINQKSIYVQNYLEIQMINESSLLAQWNACSF